MAGDQVRVERILDIGGSHSAGPRDAAHCSHSR
jgi:hypothetical protein